LGVTSSTTTTFRPAQSPTTTTTESSRELIHPVNSNSNIKHHKSYFRRKIKTVPTRAAELSRDEKENSGSGSSHVTKIAILDSINSKDFSETNDDENNLDYGLMTLSAAGEGVDSKNEDASKNSAKDEKTKTLSDQIAEGKYGLIEKELFSKVPKRPGIISYKTNSETPNDNEKTLGGLDKDEIWLAEDHLLVLKGGVPNDKKNNDYWKPIDDYEAPMRPVKIPLNPRVPPPFPVQLTEDGPLQFIGHNQFSLFNPVTNETGLFANAEGNRPANFPSSNDPNTKNLFAGPGTYRNLTKDQIHDVIPPPPWLYHNKDTDLLKQFPFNLPLPDQLFNRTEDFDEDDPALFYPPPYSFVYKSNYTNLAPVGPLVPGIILPPPPNFFSVYDPDENKKPVKTPIDVINRIKEIHLKNRLTASSTTSTFAPPKPSPTFPTLRKTKVPSTTPSSTTTRLYKTKSTTPRPAAVPTTYSTTIFHSTTQRENLVTKIHAFDTTTLKLHPVYLPTSDTTKLHSTSTTLAPPPPAIIKPYQQDYGTQAHPIYFEYFDARTANPINPNPYVGPEYDTSPITTLPPPPVYKEVTKSKKPKSYYQPQFISSTISPHPQHVDAKFLYVTPKPEHNYGTVIAQPQPYPVSTDSPLLYNTVPVQKPLVLKPAGRFEDEIAAIRQTLNYYNGKKYPQKAQKVKAVYEFSFEAAKHKDDFHPMLSYDQKSYYSPKPEINYSQYSELLKTNGYYPSTTETSVKYYRTKQSATLPPKKEANASSQMAYGQKLRPQNVGYYVRPIFKEVVSSPHQSQSQKIISYPAYETQSLPINVDHGYRINNRNVKYRKPQHQSQQQQQQFYGQASEVVSLLNDTAVNYKLPQRPINPYSEFIDISRFPQNNQQIPQNSQPYYPQQQHPIHHPIYPGPYQRPIQQQHQQQQHQQFQQQQQYQQHPLDLVKFEYPQIPQINPDSVHITFYNRPMEKSDDSYYVTPRN
jgi:hypothetical protein